MTSLWHCDPQAPFGERVVQVAATALAAGTLAEDKRADVYKLFIACGENVDISHVKTSCGIFVRAVLHWAGRPASLPASSHVGGGLVGLPSWTDLDPAKAVTAADATSKAVPGAVFWKSSPDHVGILLRELAPGVWATAEGGGGAGTECRISWRHLADDFPHLQRLWLPDDIPGVGAPPAPPSAAAPPSGALPTLIRGSSDTVAVKLLQAALATLGYYHAAIDGAFGTGTDSAVRAFQTRSSLKVDGEVGPKTWAALELAVGKPLN